MFQSAVQALVLALFSQVPEVATPPRQDWVKQDLARIEQFQKALGAPDVDVEALALAFGAIGERDDQDAGFGVRRVRMHLYGGYTTIWIDILAERGVDDHKSRIAELRARQLVPAEHWDALKPTFATAWGARVTPLEHGFQFTLRNDERIRALRQKTVEALGGGDPVSVSSELSAAFEMLTSPFDDVVLGLHHGEDGAPPPGRREIERLVDAGRLDLVRAVLRGVNPEGRLYAAWALRRRSNAPLVPQDARAIETLLALRGEVHTSEGCEQVWRSPKEALDFLEKMK